MNAQNTEKSVSGIRVTKIFIFPSSEEADEATKLPQIKKKFKYEKSNETQLYNICRWSTNLA